MPSLTLYHASPSRSSVAHWMLEELGEPYELKVLDLSKGEQRTPDYLAINPMGKVPALRHGDAVVTETGAICCYLADEFPNAGLAVPVGDPRRGPYLKWLFFGPACFEPAITDKAFPRAESPQRGMLGWGDYETVMDTIAAGLKPGPFMMGEQFTAADVVIGSSLRWGMSFGLVSPRPEFVDYTERLGQRPALQRTAPKAPDAGAQ